MNTSYNAYIAERRKVEHGLKLEMFNDGWRPFVMNRKQDYIVCYADKLERARGLMK